MKNEVSYAADLSRKTGYLLAPGFGMRVNIPFQCEEAATGAALTAVVGAGYFRNFFEAGKIIKYSFD